MLKGAAAIAISDVPGRTHRALARQSFEIARWFDEGWKNSFRATSQLSIGDVEVAKCKRYVNLFDLASEDGDREA
jgi:hypothetical protein